MTNTRNTEKKGGNLEVHCRRAVSEPRKIMIAVMIGTDYGPGEKKSQLMFICFFARRELLVLFLCLFCWQTGACFFLVTKERYPLIGYPHLVFVFAVCYFSA